MGDARATIDAAERLSRVAIAAATIGVDPAPLIEALSNTDQHMLARATLGVNHAFSRVAVRVGWPVADETRDRVLAYQATAFPEQRARMDRLFDRGNHQLSIEWVIEDGNLGCSVHSFGSNTVAEDTALILASSGASAEIGESMAAVTHPLAGLAPVSAETCDGVSDHWRVGGSHWDFRFVVAATTPAELTHHAGVLGAVASELSASEAQQRFLFSAHPSLGRGRGVFATVSMNAAGHLPRMGIEYLSVSWESAVRILEGFHPGTQAAERLGGIAGAVGTEEASMVEIELGATEPPNVAVWTALAAESEVSD